MFTADLTEKRCFVACSQEKINSGQCSCQNRTMSIYYSQSVLTDIRLAKINRILKNLEEI